MIKTRELLSPRQVRTALVERLEQSPWLVLGCVSVIYFAATLALVSKKQFWFDELITFYISRRPGFSDVWQVLLTGADIMGPLFYVITRTFTGVFGDGLLSLRLPEMLGFWAMCVSLFFFVRRRSSASHATVAMLLPMVAASFYYAYEARSYGLVLGFSGLALLCWQAAAEGRMRALSIPGLSLSLAAAVSCHYYAILCFLPFALGEFVRTMVRRRVDAPIWIAFGAGLLPLALFLPLIRAAKTYSGTFWAKPHWMDAVTFYQDLLGPAMLPILAIAVIMGLHRLTARRETSMAERDRYTLPLHEVAAACGFVLVPIVGVILAKSITGAFTNRYALSAVIGVSILLAWSMLAVGDQSYKVALLVAAGLLTVFALSTFNTYRGLVWRQQEKLMTYNFLRSQSTSGLPVVINRSLFWEFSYRATQHHEKANFVYLADALLVMRYTNRDTADRVLLTLKEYAPLNVQDFHLFCASHKSFFIYDYSEPASWVIQELIKERRPLMVTAHSGEGLLFLVTPEHDH